MSTPPRILTIAGSDSSGGAGIEADIKVITAHKCYGMTAMTGLTAQNTTGVVDIHPIPADFLRKVLSAVLEDVGVDVVKTGMLTSAQSISVIVESIKKYDLKTIVLDPVMISTSGSILLPTDAISNLCSNLIPLASLVTPNIPEAQHLLSYYTNPNMLPTTAFPIDNINSMADVVDLAKRLQEKCSTAVLVKGGHLPFLGDGSVARRQKDKAFVMDVLVLSNAASYPLGKGSGPINHVHNVYKLPYSKGHFIEYLINHPSVANTWKDYVNHDFVKSIANGTLSTEKFVWYLKQDYLFLVQFARAKALLTYKGTTLAQINDCANYLTGVIRESALHVKYCAELIPGLTERDLQSTPEAPTTTAYTRYILDVGGNGDVAALMVSLISCSVGYQVAARNRENEESSVKTAQGNTFWRWVEEYASEGYAKEVQTQRDILEEMAGGFGMTQVEELVEIFRKVTEMERNFFSAAVEAKFP
ncbi:hypothetical protein TWF788_009465 [Orbilia oligospora]|uniref:Pyridoxamine kinase/Phosphomethylpyrimidine kinase domain-containing protein n=1 Tax=Orbilia oligospora TaxID=2813651 RepID=A0A7C8KDH9_ORBOL|nr:hypothetical protein TWF788_009465 [Orbilia oligospora]